MILIHCREMLVGEKHCGFIIHLALELVERMK